MDSALRLAAALDAGALPRGAALHVQLDGLLLQGASCAPPHGLEPIAADAPTFSPMPQLYLAWVAGGEAAPMYSADKSTLLPSTSTPSARPSSPSSASRAPAPRASGLRRAPRCS